eukprot:CAMPEP_0115105734 /NCGR_PEP_ID=MMETSP0227-20121206/36189_1 /TAXON_ID=89957 /ORGANISM="Polarella glacialis, Strain CCMP 1383" /LENGTH=201 /DNA_ID=CAMNT_0002503103 /DNA_START=1 /DNA_END=606 /DNA_ORIENTATION=-
MGSRQSLMALFALSTLMALLVAGAERQRAFAGFGIRSVGLQRGLGRLPGTAAAAAADEVLKPKEVWMPLTPARKEAEGAQFFLDRFLGKDSTFKWVMAELPLGLRIIQNEGDKAFVVEDVVPMGAVALGKADIQPGDVIHAVTTTKDGGKIGIGATAIEDCGHLSRMMIGNDDGLITVVIERVGESGGGGFGFLENIARSF